MRIPFVPRDIEINQDRYDFIKEYRGGGFMLIAGACFWLLAFTLTYILPKKAIVGFYIWGGLAHPSNWFGVIQNDENVFKTESAFIISWICFLYPYCLYSSIIAR